VPLPRTLYPAPVVSRLGHPGLACTAPNPREILKPEVNTFVPYSCDALVYDTKTVQDIATLTLTVPLVSSLVAASMIT